jgi:hypothetical protein
LERAGGGDLASRHDFHEERVNPAGAGHVVNAEQSLFSVSPYSLQETHTMKKLIAVLIASAFSMGAFAQASAPAAAAPAAPAAKADVKKEAPAKKAHAKKHHAKKKAAAKPAA